MSKILALLMMGSGIAMLAIASAHADPCEAPLPKPGTVFAGRVAYIGDGWGQASGAVAFARP